MVGKIRETSISIRYTNSRSQKNQLLHMAQATTKAILVNSIHILNWAEPNRCPNITGQESSKERESGFFILCHNADSVPFRIRVNKDHGEVT